MAANSSEALHTRHLAAGLDGGCRGIEFFTGDG